MALVAYGSSDESDLSENEEEVTVAEFTKAEKRVERKPEVHPKPKFGEISDEDEDEWIGQASTGVEDLNIPGLSNSKSIFDVLPQASIKR